jgi:hypothetical protein
MSKTEATPEIFTRKCPACGKDIFYTNQKSRSQAENKNSLCSSCCQLSPERRISLLLPGNKFCNKCQITKSLLDFFNSSKTPDGKQSYCKECQNLYKLEWGRQNPDKRAATQKRYKDKDPEAFNEYHRDWKRARKQEGKLLPVSPRYRIRKVCDLTISQEDYILNWSGGPCPICQKTMAKRGCGRDLACIDHDHNTNKFRDLICGSCNTMLGFAQDDEHILLRALDYLRRHKNAQS